MGGIRGGGNSSAGILKNLTALLDELLASNPLLLQLLHLDHDSVISGLLSELPRHSTRFNDLIVLPSDTPCTHVGSLWSKIYNSSRWHALCTVLNCKRIAVLTKISSDDYRTPVIKLIHSENNYASDGSDKWVEKKDNGIIYHFNIERCMFSKGNINEKVRMARLDCSNEIVVDLYAGIGYFTLPLLAHAKAQFLYACEWNHFAVEALRKNLHANRVAVNRYEILYGDNRKCAPPAVADRVILGLLPTSEASWPTALRALKPSSGGILHVHACIDLKRKPDGKAVETLPKEHGVYQNYADFCLERLQFLTAELDNEDSRTRHWKFFIDKIVRLKSYGPLVDHVVVDVRVENFTKAFS